MGGISLNIISHFSMTFFGRSTNTCEKKSGVLLGDQNSGDPDQTSERVDRYSISTQGTFMGMCTTCAVQSCSRKLLGIYMHNLISRFWGTLEGRFYDASICETRELGMMYSYVCECFTILLLIFGNPHLGAWLLCILTFWLLIGVIIYLVFFSNGLSVSSLSSLCYMFSFTSVTIMHAIGQVSRLPIPPNADTRVSGDGAERAAAEPRLRQGYKEIIPTRTPTDRLHAYNDD